MDLSNQPIASPDRPPVVPDGPIAPPDVSIVSPNVPVAAPQRRIVTTLGTDVISSLQSLLGTVVIAIFGINGEYAVGRRLPAGEQALLRGTRAGRSSDAVPEDRARRYHRVSLSRGSAAAFCEARDRSAGRSLADGEQEGLDQRQAP